MSWEDILKSDDYDAIREAWKKSKNGVKFVSEKYREQYPEEKVDFVLPRTSWKIAREIAKPLGIDEGNMDGNMNASAWFFLSKKKLKRTESGDPDDYSYDYRYRGA